MYAIVQTGGKQYRVQPGDVLYVEKLDAEAGSNVDLDVMMLVDGESRRVGQPMLEDVKAVAKVLSIGKAKKIIVFTYKAKKNVPRKLGHRQPYTKLEIVSIG